MTTSFNHTQSTILLLWLRDKAFRQVAHEYKISYRCVIVLLSCYMYSLVVKDKFTFTAIYRFVKSYKDDMIRVYMNSLISVNMITQAGTGYVKYYVLTQLGIDTIQGIAQRTDQLLYDFCSKYSIEL